jgi:ATP-dependent helicase/nuclease subunit B
MSRSDHNAFVITNASEILADCVQDLARIARAGAFRPVASEIGFSGVRDATEDLGRFGLPLPDGRVLVLRGKIDRLDVAEVDGKRTAIVLDYKTSVSGATFGWKKFQHGLDIQLPLYLLALLNTEGVRVDDVAGAFCVPIQVSPSSSSLGSRDKEAGKTARKAKGLFNGDYYRSLDPQAGSRWSRFYNFAVTKDKEQYAYYRDSGALEPEKFQAVLKLAREKVITLAGDIVRGEITVHPYRLGTETPCSNCDYKPVCRFDWQINDYRDLESGDKLAVIEKLKAS